MGFNGLKKKRSKREYLITRDMLSLLNKGAIILDLSVDFPNPIECCRPSLHNKPVYTVDGIRCVSIYGYPKLVPVSSSRRYSSQVLPLVLKIASTPLDKLPKGIRDAVIDPANLDFDPAVKPTNPYDIKKMLSSKIMQRVKKSDLSKGDFVLREALITTDYCLIT